MADKSQVIVADATLAVQAQLVDVLSGAVNVTSVINAEQLWHRLEQGHGDTDLLILDAALVAPGLDVFCRKWLAAPETRAADIIVMGPDNSDYEVMALTAGAVDYLRKPLNLPVCLARVKNALRQRERRQQLESMSLTDSLTGLANRRYLDDFLQSEWRQAQRTQGMIVTTSILVINCGSSSIKFALYHKSDLKQPTLSAVAEKLGEEQPDIIYQGSINGQEMLPAHSGHR